MAAMSVKEDNSAILSQCLDFCQTLAGKSLNFSFTLTLGNNFSFSLDTSEKKALAPKAKKKSPSTLRRDARRRNEFVRKKLEASTGEKAFKCNQCGNNFKSENGLKIHVGKAHRKVNLATPDHLRQQPKRSVSLSASPLLDTSREEPCLNSNATPPSRQLGMELEENCQTCERKLYSSMCCAEEEYVCDDCCSYVLKCQNSATRKL